MGKAALRVFIGIPAEEELRRQVQEFRKRYSGLHVRWMKPENLHLTVIPPWMCEKPEAACIALREAAGLFPATDARFTLVTPGPLVTNPRLLWAIGEASPFFDSLRGELCARIPLERDQEHSFLLHLTIARVRREEGNVLARMQFRVSVEWNACIRKISLYESILKPAGAEYRVLCEIPFAIRNSNEK
jgi:2'-5' RNA ligase